VAEVIGRALIRVLPQTAEFAVHLRNDLKRTFQTITDSFAVLGTQALAGAGVALGGVAFNLAGAFALIPAAAGSATVALGALAVGFQGVGKAIKDAGDPKKFAKDLEKLSPEARKAAIAVKDLGIQAGAFRVAVQDALFKDMDATITKLGNTLLPGVKKNFVEIAAAVNDGARAFAIFAGSKQTVADLNNLFANTKTSLHILAPAGIAFGSAIRDIVSVGSNFLPIIASSITSVTERFAAFIAKARDSGQLSAFFARGIQTLHTLIDIFKNLGQTVLSIFRTASGAGVGFLQSIDNISKALKDFFTSDPGKFAVTQFLTSAKEAAVALGPVLKAVFLVFSGEIAPILGNIGKVLGPPVTEFVNGLGKALKIAEPGIDALARGFGALVRGIAPALPAVGRLADIIGQSLGHVLEALAPTLEKVVTVLANSLALALSDPKLINGLIAIGQAFGDLIIALAPLLPSLAELAGIILKALADVLSAIAPVLADVIKQFIDALLPFLPGLVQAFVDLVKAILPLVKDLLPPMVELMKVLLPVIRPVLELIVLFLRLAEPLIKVIAILVTAILKFVEAVERGIATAARIFKFFVFTISGDSEKARDSMVERIAGEAVPAVIDSLGQAGDALTRLEGGVFHFVTVMSFGSDGAANAAERLQKRSGTAFDGVSNAATDAAVKLVATLFPSFDAIAEKGAGAFSAIADAANRSFLVTVKQSRDILLQVARIFSSADFGPAGTALVGSFAEGMVNSRAQLLIQKAARQVVEAVASWFPHSPAEVGPFSGRGWTPFRGQALVEGFAQGISSEKDTLNSALGGLFGDVANQFGGVQAPNVPMRVGAFGSTGGASSAAAVAGASAGAAAGDVTEVHVFIGEQELTQLVNGVVVKKNRDTRRKALAGTGRAR
jgi:phage-related protein